MRSNKTSSLLVMTINMLCKNACEARCNRCAQLTEAQEAFQYSPCIMCVQYMGGCSVHRGEYIGGEYIGGGGSTSGGTMSTSRGYHEYIGGCSVHWRIS